MTEQNKHAEAEARANHRAGDPRCLECVRLTSTSSCVTWACLDALLKPSEDGPLKHFLSDRYGGLNDIRTAERQRCPMAKSGRARTAVHHPQRRRRSPFEPCQFRCPHPQIDATPQPTQNPVESRSPRASYNGYYPSFPSPCALSNTTIHARSHVTFSLISS